VNDGAGFWWANSMNAFTRNVAAECDEYGYFFQAIETPDFKPAFDIRQPDGSKKTIDVRTLPFMRFEDNESNCQRRHGFNLGGSVPFGKGVDGVGPDTSHPFVVKNFRVWNSHWAIHPVSPSLMIDGLDVHACEYGPWRAVYKDHAYRNVRLDQIAVNAEFMPIGTRPVEAQYPKPLKPVDDLPPVTVITRVIAAGAGKVVVRGTTADNGEIHSVSVNGHRARSLAEDYSEWEVTLDDLKTGRAVLTAVAEDEAGNIEKTPHVMTIDVGP